MYEQLYSGGIMTLNQKTDFFLDMRDWSERKLKLLRNYVAAASKIMRSSYYVDGFAGSGIYEDGSMGSPVRIAELALSYEREEKNYSIKCINVEQDKERFANLEASTSKYGGTVLNLQGTFVENSDKIVREVKSQPVICFLDPFGIKGIDWETIEKIINRGPYAPTDIWIRFDTQMVARLYGFYNSTSPGAEKKFDILPKVFGFKDKHDLYKHLSGSTSQERLQKGIDLYGQQLIQCFSKFRGTGFAACYPIKTLNNQCKYYLMFATAHEMGAILASETVYGVEETYQREAQEFKERQARQLSLFSLDPTEEEIFQKKVEELQDDIWKACKGETLSRTNIYITIWEKWFGRIKGKHMTAALNQLTNNGYILNVEGPISRSNSMIKFRS